MPIDPHAIDETIEELLPLATDFLCKLISFPSTSGNEHELMCWAQSAFAKLGVTVERVPLSDAIKADPDYSSPIPDIQYDGRFNLRLKLPGSGQGRRLLLSSHVDVVPPSQGQIKPFEAVVRDGVVYGRGACDAKGQIATIYLVLAALQSLKVPLAGEVIAHIVNEEENGGNGTLAMVRAGENADGCVVMEPTTNKIYTSVRGAVWFRIHCVGKPGHSGRAGDTVSALTLARSVMDVLDRYHDDLLAASKGIALFDKYENPMPITFGRCAAGDWPATAPAHAIIEGVLGFLPNRTRQEIMSEMRSALDNSADARLRERVTVEFTYRHDSHVLDPEHALVAELKQSCHDWTLPVEVDAMTASCDSWLYNNQLGIPTVVYGPGTLAFAHSNEEQIALEEIGTAARVLTSLAERWCR